MSEIVDEKGFKKEFNELLVDTFHLILQTELQMIKKYEYNSLSMREIHLLEIVGKATGGITISDIAKTFQITLASVTVMVQKLEKQGLLEKNKHNTDKRSVLLVLTDEGKKIDKMHYTFHKEMVTSIIKGFTDFERHVLYECVKRLNVFFKDELNK